MTRARRRASLAARLAAIGAVPLVVAVVAGALFQWWLGMPLLAIALGAIVAVPLWAWAVHRALRPALSLFRAMSGLAAAYRDGELSMGLHWEGSDELADLVAAHDELGATLRAQRQSLVQRELLLDTMVQHAPVAMMLCDANGRIVHANVAARKLLNGGARLDGLALDTILAGSPPAVREAIARGGDGLFAVGGERGEAGEGFEDQEVFHLARRAFHLNGRAHELLLLRRLTAELRRQEVRTWKTVIRVISHELNNSLGPIASLAESGSELVRRGETAQLGRVFATIEERARHLDAFIRGYARFAKLPSPRPEHVAWAAFLERLRSQIAFRIDPPVPDVVGRFDPGQLEQALLNLLKNAHESGSRPEDVAVALVRVPGAWRVDVLDRGTGMSEASLASALVPFYSTKRAGTGTGVGLALAREIAEAHGGAIAIANRAGGGLVVTLTLPD